MSCSFSSPGNCEAGHLGPSLASACHASNFFVFMSLLDALIRNNEKISGACERVESVKETDDEYDFVVVGGGAAGAVVASRLSEIEDWKVLLLEAGPDEPAGAEIPSFVGEYLGTELNWMYKTTNESNACLSTNGSCSWPSGKNLGGTTVHNHMVYLRGNPTDYNKWAAEGNYGWRWEDVEPVFKMAEDNGEIERVGRKHHSTGGPLSVERFPYLPEFALDVFAAAEEAGFKVSPDLNGDMITGFTVTQASSKNGVRRSSSRAYLWPARHRRNLHISLNSFVTRVIVEQDKTVGVEYHKDGRRKRVGVTREVIISAGTVSSPQILLLSGIGPKQHLESVGVNVVTDLPGVGENLHDHPSISIGFTVNDTDTYGNDWLVSSEYVADQTGPLSSTGLAQMLGIVATDETTPDYPDIEIFVSGYEADCAPGEIDALSSTGRRTVSLLPSLLHPESKGRITLASNDPFDKPVIWSNYFGQSSDIRRLIKGIRMALALANTKALQARDFRIDPPIQACSNHKFSSDEYWSCVARQNTVPEHHQAGSCKMGPESDDMAVVDPRLRVHKIKGLRVADASIMPQAVSGNTAAPAMMIGERAAAFIRQDWS